MSTLVLANGVTIATEARAERVWFDREFLLCQLQDGRIVSVPISWYPRLRDASPEARENWELIGGGRGIHWPALDEDLEVGACMVGCQEDEVDDHNEKV